MELRHDLRPDDEGERLVEMRDACHRVLPLLGERDDRLAEAIRRTCHEVEARLEELGIQQTGRRQPRP